MFSISFLPWAMLLLAVILSVPIVSFVEASRRKKELAALQEQSSQSAGDDGEVYDVGEGLDGAGAADGGFGDAGFDEGNFGGGTFDGGFGDDFGDTKAN